MAAFVLSFCILYLLFISWLVVGFSKGERQVSRITSAEEIECPPFTILIPFRNEEASLNRLCPELYALFDSNSSLGKVILVNDRSEDESCAIVQHWAEQESRIQLLDSCGIGKLAAIRTGVDYVETDWIIALDADVTLPSSWSKAIHASVARFRDSDMIILPIRGSYSDSLAAKYSCIDFMSLIGSTMAFAGHGDPVMSNGAHMAYKKKWATWHDDIVSGDDVFLLHAIKTLKGKVSFDMSPGLLVDTPMPSSWRQSIEQRTRWASKALNYQDPMTLAVGTLVLFMNLTLWLVFISAIFRIENWSVFLTMFCIKSLADWWFLYRTLKWSGQLSLLPYLPIASIINWLIIPIAFFRYHVIGFEWKGRAYS